MRWKLNILLAYTVFGVVLTGCDTTSPSDHEAEVVVEAYLVGGESLPPVWVSVTEDVDTAYDGADLAGANLRGATLQGTVFAEADMDWWFLPATETVAAPGDGFDFAGHDQNLLLVAGTLSGGQRARVAVLRVLLSEPRALLLDEPFSGLDPLWRARFREVLAAERRRGATLFFSSHILSDVEHLCDHYAVIDHGTVLETGALAELLGQAPLQLTGSGPRPEGAESVADDQWRVSFPEDRRDAVLAQVAQAGGRILRLERQRQALEDYFVGRVRDRHGAGRAVPEEAP